MGLPDRVLGSRSVDHPAESRVAKAIESTEEAVALREIRRWGDRQVLAVDLEARARASHQALDLDLQLYDSGMARADGDPVKAELVLRAVEDQNCDNRSLIRKALGS